jgi:signal transduction histidine kinase
MVAKGSFPVLIIEDNPGDFALVEEFLLDRADAPRITHVRTYKQAKHLLDHETFDVILLDLSLPDKTGSDLINDILKISGNAPVIVLTGYPDFDFGVQSIAQGVSDYVLKDELTPLTLYKSIIYSLERRKIIASLQASEKRVRDFAKQLNRLVEDERARIAREIHDEFGQQLSGIKMSLSALKNNNRKGQHIVPVVDSILDEVNGSIRSLRQISNELRPVLLDKLGLFAAIEWLLQEFSRKTGIEIQFGVNSDPFVINKGFEINIFRICQEALTNITKHAEATMVTIDITNKGSHLIISIKDNGKGVNTANLDNPLSSGLLNMRERASLIGADLHITSGDGKGTSIKLIVNGKWKENIDS